MSLPMEEIRRRIREKREQISELRYDLERLRVGHIYQVVGTPEGCVRLSFTAAAGGRAVVTRLTSSGIEKTVVDAGAMAGILYLWGIGGPWKIVEVK